MVKNLDDAIARLENLISNATPFNSAADAADLVLKEMRRLQGLVNDPARCFLEPRAKRRTRGCSVRNLEQIAAELLRLACEREVTSAMVGDVTAMEVARLAVHAITSCPACGAEPGVNIDCRICAVCDAMAEDA